MLSELILKQKQNKTTTIMRDGNFRLDLTKKKQIMAVEEKER